MTISTLLGTMNGDGGSGSLTLKVATEQGYSLLYKALKDEGPRLLTLSSKAYSSIAGLSGGQGGMSNFYSLEVPDGTILWGKAQYRGGIGNIRQGMFAVEVSPFAPLYKVSMKLPVVPRRSVEEYRLEGRFRFLGYDMLCALGHDPGAHFTDWFDADNVDEVIQTTMLDAGTKRTREVRKVVTYTNSDGVVVREVEEMRLRKTGRRVKR